MPMKQSAILINTARGEVVDSEALRKALESGWIAGAGLDVTDPEPLPGYHPLLGAPNLTVVPHIGSASHATRGRMAAMAVDNLLAALAGEPMPSPGRLTTGPQPTAEAEPAESRRLRGSTGAAAARGDRGLGHGRPARRRARDRRSTPPGRAAATAVARRGGGLAS